MTTQPTLFDAPRDPALERADLNREYDRLLAEWEGRNGTAPPTLERKQQIDRRIRAIRERLTTLRETIARSAASAARPVGTPNVVDRRTASAGRERD